MPLLRDIASHYLVTSEAINLSIVSNLTGILVRSEEIYKTKLELLSYYWSIQMVGPVGALRTCLSEIWYFIGISLIIYVCRLPYSIYLFPLTGILRFGVGFCWVEVLIILLSVFGRWSDSFIYHHMRHLCLVYFIITISILYLGMLSQESLLTLGSPQLGQELHNILSYD